MSTKRVSGGGAEEFWLCGHGPETEGRGSCFCLVLAKESDLVQGDKWQSLLRSGGLDDEGRYPLALATAHRAGKHLTKKTQAKKKKKGETSTEKWRGKHQKGIRFKGSSLLFTSFLPSENRKKTRVCHLYPLVLWPGPIGDHHSFPLLQLHGWKEEENSCI